ncbi:multisubunit Na+/H+ antiporter MnhC subunit [Paenibacillus phyllosphaerae]|uniref:Multisubunit Na+/H+ antiporter MnhC subunit n=1 Tax=Paenibacillus phyllosphaerae TaxID=274593 RepID=A0A7W5FLG2_9BACL|nr:multisubunit Na+/H+ antiporter MnhC subunit [Paenibacillus phyllosphaerae]
MTLVYILAILIALGLTALFLFVTKKAYSRKWEDDE